MQINESVIKESTRMIEGLLRKHEAGLELAYLQAENALKVGLSLKISPDKDSLKLETTISFVTEQIKDSDVSTINERQISLFEDQSKGKLLTMYPKNRVGNPPRFVGLGG